MKNCWENFDLILVPKRLILIDPQFKFSLLSVPRRLSMIVEVKTYIQGRLNVTGWRHCVYSLDTKYLKPLFKLGKTQNMFRRLLLKACEEFHQANVFLYFIVFLWKETWSEHSYWRRHQTHDPRKSVWETLSPGTVPTFTLLVPLFYRMSGRSSYISANWRCVLCAYVYLCSVCTWPDNYIDILCMSALFL